MAIRMTPAEFRERFPDQAWKVDGSDNPSAQPRQGKKGKGGFREDIGIYVRSMWEANYMRFLQWLRYERQILGYGYELDTFEFPVKRGTRFYTPDFRVLTLEHKVEYHEVKGWLDPKSKTQLKRMAKYYPEIKIVLIGPKEYGLISKNIGSLIPNWEKENL